MAKLSLMKCDWVWHVGNCEIFFLCVQIINTAIRANLLSFLVEESTLYLALLIHSSASFILRS